MKHSRRRAVAALALAGAATGGAGSAAAQESTGAVTLYGRLNTALEHVSASGAGPELSASRLSNYRSVFGFRGEEGLGSGLKAVWQVESAVSLDTGGGTLAGRDTRLGLAGPWGTLFAGTWTLPYTSATAGFDPFYPTTAGYMSLMGNGSAPSTDHLIDTSSFDRRQRNQVQYWSPAWRGLSARLAHGLSEERPDDGRKPRLASGSLSWEGGGLTLTAAHERHHEYEAPDTRDTASKLGAAYRLGPARLAAVVERLRYETATGTLRRNAWYVSAVVRLGAGSLRAGYTRAGDGRGDAAETVGFFRSGADTGASQLTVGYEHELSKRTAIYAYASRISNERAALYDFAINELGIAPGQRPRVLALGLRHQF